MFELLLEDEYGHKDFLGKSEDIQKLIAQAKKYVQDENMDNALTIEDQKTDFTHYFVEFFQDDELADNVIYAGKKGGRRMALVIEDDEVSEVPVDGLDGLNPRFYLGEFVSDKKNGVKKTIYADDVKRKLAVKFDNDLLSGRGCLYIVKK